MAKKTPSRRFQLLATLVLLAWVDLLGFIGFRLEDSVLSTHVMLTTLGWIWIGIDLFLYSGLLFRVAWSEELLRLRCFIHFGFLIYMWISYLMLFRPVGAPLFDSLALAGVVRDGLAGLFLLAVFFLWKKREPKLPKPAQSEA